MRDQARYRGLYECRVRLPGTAAHRSRRDAVPPADRRLRVHVRGGRPPVRAGRSRGVDAAYEDGDVRDRAPAAARSPCATARDPRRPRSVAQRRVRGDGALEERVHRRGRDPAVVSGHRHCDRQGEEGRARAHGRWRSRGDRARHLPYQRTTALLANGPDTTYEEQNTGTNLPPRSRSIGDNDSYDCCSCDGGSASEPCPGDEPQPIRWYCRRSCALGTAACPPYHLAPWRR